MVSAGDFKNGLTVEIDGKYLSDYGISACKTGKRRGFCKNQAEKHYQRRCC